uniref:FHA domain-containing protein n=1 Tax=uncultured Thiotrichaceae bacterium TaxID=298394 RepID=A0A6S6UF01_9GAMM|nr:MAG: Unknown protein [uncultured Thiotrichaceae bacterium]
MAQVEHPPELVLEIHTRSLNQYHRLTHFPVRIGRALDNDIILSDATVSSHHMEIDLADNGQLLIRNLSKENGSKVNRQVMSDKVLSLELGRQPLELLLGARRARVFRSDMEIAKTSVRHCSGLYKLFCKPAWSVALMVITLFVFLFEKYLQTVYAKEPSYYLSDLMPYLLAMIVLTLVVSGISRLSIRRWEIGSALSFAALLMLGPQLLGELGHKLNYLFTATWPMDWVSLVADFLWMPFLLYLYVRLVHHSSAIGAMGVALLFSAPMILYQASDYADQLAIADEYTGEANFSRELSSLNIRMAPTLSVDDFIDQLRDDLGPADSD